MHPYLTMSSRSLRPGGKIELSEFDMQYTSDDGTVTEDNQLVKFTKELKATAIQVGCDFDAAPKYEQMLKDAGYANVHADIRKMPMGPWTKDQRLKTTGYCHREQILQGLPGIAMGLLTRVRKWSKEEVDVFVALIRQDILNRKIHGYWKS